MDWYKEGVKAGKTEGWMNLEETLSEDLEAHPQFARDSSELVQTSIDGWEETDHFNMLYGSDMMNDAMKSSDDDRDEAIDVYQDNKSEFWEGYLVGRRRIGRDIYKLAKKLIDKKSKPKSTKRKPKSKSKSRSGDAGMLGMRG